MSRTLLIVLALVATAYAGRSSSSLYAFNQVDEIDARVAVCLEPVPENGGQYYIPGTNCRFQARDNVRYGASKESLPGTISYCLLHFYPRGVDAAIVATAKQCLIQSLSKPLPPALQPAHYSSEQLAEIDDRIKACLAPIPERPYSSPVKDCRVEALYESDQYPHYPKESLTIFTISCLTRKAFDATLVAAAQPCLVASLAKPLSA